MTNKRIMSKISENEVKQIAALARLELTEKDIAKYQKELSAILGYIDLTSEVDTKNVAPTAQVTGLTDVTREDGKIPSELSRDEIFSNTPEKQSGYIKVKAVLE